MGCATKTMKYGLLICNAVWAIYGVLLIVLGSLGWDAMPESYSIGSICMGIVIFMIAVFGCFATLRESARSLWTYAVIMLVLLVLVIISICFNTRNVFKNYALSQVEETWAKELHHPGAMDNMQQIYACCGRNFADDYNNMNRSVPASCCKDNNCINPSNLYLEGCLTKVEKDFSDEARITKFNEWFVLGFNITVLVLTVILAIHYTNQKRRYNY